MIGGAAILQVSTYDGRDIDVATTGAVVMPTLPWFGPRKRSPPHPPGASKPWYGHTGHRCRLPARRALTTTHGKVLGYAPDPVGWSALPMLVNDAPIEHGSSGSPVINDSGQLVGVAYAADGSKYAVPVEILRQVLGNPSS